MKHKPYSKYKPSGIEWIGDIPEGWEILRLKFIASTKFSNVDKHSKEEEQPVSLCNYVDVYYNDFIDSNMDFMQATATNDEIRKFALNKGDVIVTKDSESWDDIAIPAYVKEDMQGVLCGYHLAMIQANQNMRGEYIFWSFLSQIINYQFQVSATGVTRYGLGKWSLDNAMFFVPSKKEQHQIAKYLDQKTAQIDDLIQKKEEMIKLLKEKRAAIINQAVTKGLNPNAKMKPSGVDWIGDIPEGWRVLRLKYKISLDPSKNEVLKIISLDDDVTFLPMAYVTEGGDINDENEKKLEDVFSGYTYFRDNDVVVAKITPCFENGKGALIKGMKNEVGFGTTEFFVLRSKSLDEKYLFYLTKSDYFRKIGEASMKGAAGQKRIPDSFIKDFKIGFPEQTEQKRIANYLDKKTTEIDGLIQKIESVIAKLFEYRSSLITAAVTGKIDVRGDISL